MRPMILYIGATLLYEKVEEKRRCLEKKINLCSISQENIGFWGSSNQIGDGTHLRASKLAKNNY